MTASQTTLNQDTRFIGRVSEANRQRSHIALSARQRFCDAQVILRVDTRPNQTLQLTADRREAQFYFMNQFSMLALLAAVSGS
jgi:hypothetical protein